MFSTTAGANKLNFDQSTSLLSVRYPNQQFDPDQWIDQKKISHGAMYVLGQMPIGHTVGNSIRIGIKSNCEPNLYLSHIRPGLNVSGKIDFRL